MRNHFNSAHRWSYVIISVVGSGHRHFIVSDIVDQNSLYSVKKSFDSKYDGFCTAPDSITANYPCLYGLANLVDKNSAYNEYNPINSSSLFVIYYRGDYNR